MKAFFWSSSTSPIHCHVSSHSEPVVFHRMGINEILALATGISQSNPDRFVLGILIYQVGLGFYTRPLRPRNLHWTRWIGTLSPLELKSKKLAVNFWGITAAVCCSHSHSQAARNLDCNISRFNSKFRRGWVVRCLDGGSGWRVFNWVLISPATPNNQAPIRPNSTTSFRLMPGHN